MGADQRAERINCASDFQRLAILKPMTDTTKLAQRVVVEVQG